MPGMSCGFDRDFGRRTAAWTAHYQRKGCSSTKAQAVAWKKCRKGFTWPPKGDEIGV